MRARPQKNPVVLDLKQPTTPRPLSVQVVEPLTIRHQAGGHMRLSSALRKLERAVRPSMVLSSGRVFHGPLPAEGSLYEVLSGNVLRKVIRMG